MRLEGKVCVITGASGGIGAASVELFQREGAKVVGVDLLPGAPGDLSLEIDVTDEAQVASMYARACEQFGAINVIFNNAGISQLLVNDPPGGSVINTASFVAVMGAATSQISYTASKGGVLALSRELGVEFARLGVRVNALCPGPVDTPLLRELFAKDPERAARRIVHIPVGRFARAEEIAGAALFLASDESTYVTASSFLVDGGISGAYTTPL